jgi:hypothetical protein
MQNIKEFTETIIYNPFTSLIITYVVTIIYIYVFFRLDYINRINIMENNRINIMEKEEHFLSIYDNQYNNDFAFLWEKISSQFIFSIIKYEKPLENDENDLDENDYFYEKKFVNKIYTPASNEKIIYHDSNTQRLMIIKNSMFFNHIYAVRDELEPNRYFVGFNSFGQYANITTIGMIIYFDDDGNVKNKKIFLRELCNYDSRNGLIETYLYNQSLIFTQIHRDTSAFMMNIVLLSYDDCFETRNKFYFEKIKTICKFENNRDVLNKRFIKVETIDTNRLFDMGSTRIEINKSNKTENQLIITSYKVSNSELENFINSFSDNNEYYNDGYANNCIECGEVTSIANYSYSNSKYSATHLGLGRGYCFKCQIRYSKTEQIWKCCKLKNNDDYLCSNTVTKNNMCKKEHSTANEIVIKSYGEQSCKFPYKKEINLTRK